MQQHPSTEEKEIDFSYVSGKVKGSIATINNFFIDCILFIKRNIIFLIVLFILGAGMGYYFDKKSKSYDSTMIVLPNFGTVDYLYSKVNLLNAKIKERDTAFIKSIGIDKPKKLTFIEIKPINDVYDFVNQRATNFELLKLMAEDGNIEKVVEGPVTSKNYPNHLITFTTNGKTTDEATTKPILAYLNDSPYYARMQKEQSNNLEIKMRVNDSIIKQIDGILASFKNTTSGAGGKNSSLVYYNENTQLADIIKRKDELVSEQAFLRISRLNYDKVVKDTSTTLNVINKEGLTGKLKYVMPFFFMALFCIFVFFFKYIKSASKAEKARA